jgi:hypothetical protein
VLQGTGSKLLPAIEVVNTKDQGELRRAVSPWLRPIAWSTARGQRRRPVYAGRNTWLKRVRAKSARAWSACYSPMFKRPRARFQRMPSIEAIDDSRLRTSSASDTSRAGATSPRFAVAAVESRARLAETAGDERFMTVVLMCLWRAARAAIES